MSSVSSRFIFAAALFLLLAAFQISEATPNSDKASAAKVSENITVQNDSSHIAAGANFPDGPHHLRFKRRGGGGGGRTSGLTGALATGAAQGAAGAATGGILGALFNGR